MLAEVALITTAEADAKTATAADKAAKDLVVTQKTTERATAKKAEEDTADKAHCKVPGRPLERLRP